MWSFFIPRKQWPVGDIPVEENSESVGSEILLVKHKIVGCCTNKTPICMYIYMYIYIYGYILYTYFIFTYTYKILTLICGISIHYEAQLHAKSLLALLVDLNY